jgi:hypothetical protein
LRDPEPHRSKYQGLAATFTFFAAVLCELCGLRSALPQENAPLPIAKGLLTKMAVRPYNRELVDKVKDGN